MTLKVLVARKDRPKRGARFSRVFSDAVKKKPEANVQSLAGRSFRAALRGRLCMYGILATCIAIMAMFLGLFALSVDLESRGVNESMFTGAETAGPVTAGSVQYSSDMR